MADQLAEADARHDGWGTAAYKLAEALRALPNASAALKSGADAVLTTYVPSLDSLQKRYLDEVAAATENRTRLKADRAVLEAVPTPDGATLYTWIKAQLDAAAELDALLEARADAPRGARREVTRLRSKGISLLNNFRAALLDEMEMDPKLPRDLEQKVFGYMDFAVAARSRGTDVEQDDDGGDPVPPTPAPTPA
jgi:hypothetical protein